MPASASNMCWSSTYGRQWASPNKHLRAKIAAIWATMANMGENDDKDTSTQLDSYATIIVIGRHTTVFENSNETFSQ